MTTTAPAASSSSMSRRSTAWALAWFMPPVLWVVTRRWLAWFEGRHPPPPAWRLEPFQGNQTAWELLAPWLLGLVLVLAVVAALVASVRRWGALRAGRCWVVAWMALWLAAAGREVHSHQQLRHLVPEASAVPAKVLGHRVREPSLRSPGGTWVVLELPAFAGQLHQILLPSSAGAAGWPAGTIVLLQTARDRSERLWLTGWQEAPSQP